MDVGRKIAGERPYGQIYAERLGRWEGERLLAAARMCIGNFSCAPNPRPGPGAEHARSSRPVYASCAGKCSVLEK